MHILMKCVVCGTFWPCRQVAVAEAEEDEEEGDVECAKITTQISPSRRSRLRVIITGKKQR